VTSGLRLGSVPRRVADALCVLCTIIALAACGPAGVGEPEAVRAGRASEPEQAAPPGVGTIQAVWPGAAERARRKGVVAEADRRMMEAALAGDDADAAALAARVLDDLERVARGEPPATPPPDVDTLGYRARFGRTAAGRRAAVQALDGLRTEAAAHALTRSLDEADPVTRGAAVAALWRAAADGLDADGQVRIALESAAAHPDAATAALARRALEDLNRFSRPGRLDPVEPRRKEAERGQ
jgi:hypothetical protein